MTPEAPGGPATPDPGEERRYRETREIDPHAPGAVQALLDRLDDPSWRVRGAAAGRLAQCDPARAVPQLVAALAGPRGPGSRAAAAGALVLVGEAALPALEAALESSWVELRIAAAEVLGDLGARWGVTALARRLADPDPNVALTAAGALAKLGGAHAVRALLAASATGGSALRRAALDGLARLRTPLPAARLAELYADAGSRRLAVRLAAFCVEPGAVAVLASAVADPSRATREAALESLGHRRLEALPENGGAGALREAVVGSAAAVASAEAALDEAALPLRAGAVVVLGLAGRGEAAPALSRAAADDLLRPLALAALRELGPATVAPLRAALPALQGAGRAVAAAALGAAGAPEGKVALQAALAGADPEAREVAMELLAAAGDASALPAILAELTGDAPAVAAGALGALARHPASRAAVLATCRALPPPWPPVWSRLVGEVGEAEDGPRLLATIALRDAPGRAPAVAALGVLSARSGEADRAWSPLLGALDDLDPEVRAAAATALGALAGSGAARPPAVELALALALGDGEHGVRAAAASALGRCGARAHAPRLAERARDPAAAPDEVAAALGALAGLGLATAELLDGAASHPDPEVVKQAVEAAAGLAGPAGAALLLRAAEHARWDVRRAAAVALGARGERALLPQLERLAASERDGLVAEALQRAFQALAEGPERA